MADLISRAAAIDAIISETIDKVCKASPSEDNGWVGGIRDAINAVEEVNAVDAAPVVRCKDCKYWYAEIGASTGWLPCQEIATDRNWYCASGKRREQDAERNANQ